MSIEVLGQLLPEGNVALALGKGLEGSAVNVGDNIVVPIDLNGVGDLAEVRHCLIELDAGYLVRVERKAHYRGICIRAVDLCFQELSVLTGVGFENIKGGFLVF